MKKMMLVGLIMISALSFAGKSGGNGSGGKENSSGGNMNQQQKEIKMTTQTKNQQRIYLDEKDRDNIMKKENSKSLNFRKSMEKKYRANWDEIEEAARSRMTTRTKNQQRIYLDEKDRDNIMKKENSKSLNFRKSMEKKYRTNWDEIEDAARRME